MSKNFIAAGQPAFPFKYEEEYGDRGNKMEHVFEGLTTEQFFFLQMLKSVFTHDAIMDSYNRENLIKEAYATAKEAITYYNEQEKKLEAEQREKYAREFPDEF